LLSGCTRGAHEIFVGSGERIVVMTEVHDDELGALRKRAYGRDSDIQLDPQAVDRLRELEGVSAALGPVAMANHSRSVTGTVVEQPLLREAEAKAEAEAEAEAEGEHLAHQLFRRLLRIRRSTVLIVLGLAVLMIAIAAALVLVQRVQPDPLQVGARQVARLSVDPSYEVPAFFGDGIDPNIQPEGFEELSGIRVVVTAVGLFRGGSNEACLNVYAAADVTDPKSESFSGAMFGGCSAGIFPAMTQFGLDTPGLSGVFQSAYPNSTALQFVYDRVNNEVVVFTDE